MRRLVLVAVTGGAVVTAVWLLRRDPEALEWAGAAEWPPLRLIAPSVEATPAAAPIGPDAPWVAATDGTCPGSHPVKGNPATRIYHLPGGRYYAASHAPRCYRDPAAAEADGLRAAKR